MAVPLPQATAIPEPIATERLTVGSAIPLVVDQLRRAGAGPFLDLPLPQLPPPSELPSTPEPPQAPGVGQPGPDLSHVLTPGQHPAAAAPAATGLPQLPALPANPVEALMQGLHLPSMPGVDQLMSPLLGLLNSFGSGVLGAVNPAEILQDGAQVMEGAMQVGSQALQVLMQTWQGGAAQAAHISGQQATTKGNEVSKQGKKIADITNKATDQVNRGYQQLVGIARGFAAQAVPIAATGAILTPPGQFALMQAATTAFGQATVVVGQTRAALAGLTADINAAGGLIQVLENSGIDLPTIANQMAEVAQPVVSQVGDALSGSHDDSGGGSFAGSQLFGGDSGTDQTTAASYIGDPLPAGLGGEAATFAGGGGSAGSFDGGGTGLDSTPDGGEAPPAEPTLGGAPTVSTPTPALAATAQAAGGTTTGSSPGNSAPVGGVTPAAAARGTETQHHRTVQPYQTTALRTPAAGLPPVAPAVLGADDPEADARYESEYGYYSDPDGDHDHSSSAG